MNVLIVDDEKLIVEVVKEYCLLNKYNVTTANNGKEAIEKVNSETDIIIMDIMMPVMDGFSAVKEIRKEYDTPVIMLSARDTEYDKLVGFELGIDDYVSKPFSPKELMARIKTVTKRNKKDKDILKYKYLEINKIAHTVTIRENVIKLTPKEYDLLIYFLENKNIALSREQLLTKIWGYDFFGDDRTIDTHIKMLRNNILEYKSNIVTIRGVGYKFEETN
ncbi:MAG: response regulator transcription factor [Mycoplasmatota bacterium]